MSGTQVPRLQYLDDPKHRAWLVQLRTVVEPTLRNNLLPHFTDHSVEHSDSLTELVAELITPLRGGPHELSQMDLLLVYATCYLHDIGMHYEAAGETTAIREQMQARGLGLSWRDLEEQTRRDLLRDCHPAISAEMIVKSRGSAFPPIAIHFPDEYEPHFIACLCHAHGVPAPSEIYDELTTDQPGIRLQLLSAIFRMADILDESRKRATRERARTLLLDEISASHWWRHHYTAKVVFDQDHRTITLCFEFPPNRRMEFSEIVPKLQLPYIADEFKRHIEILNRYHCAWTLKEYVDDGPYRWVEEMPHQVEMAMRKQIRWKREHEDSQRRLAILESMNEMHAISNRQIKTIRDSENSSCADDRLLEIHRISADLWAADSHRSAWMLLFGEYERLAEQVSTTNRVTIGLYLSGMMLDDDGALWASRILAGLQPLIESTVTPDAQRLSFWKLWAKCSLMGWNYEQTLSGLNNARRLEPSNSEIDLIDASIAESAYLFGEIPSASLTDASEVHR